MFVHYDELSSVTLCTASCIALYHVDSSTIIVEVLLNHFMPTVAIWLQL